MAIPILPKTLTYPKTGMIDSAANADVSPKETDYDAHAGCPKTLRTEAAPMTLHEKP